MQNSYGRKLNPQRRHKEPLGVKGHRKSIVITNNPSTIDAKQTLRVNFPNLGANDVIIPGSARLAFTISLTSDDANATLVQNIGRAIVNRVTIKISGNEVLSLDDSNIFNTYMDLWKTSQERDNLQYQGIDTSTDRNVTKIRMGVDDVANKPEDNAIATIYTNRFYVPLDFELLNTHAPFYQSGLGDRLEYELYFNDYSEVIKSTQAATYTIDNITLEFDQVTHAGLAKEIASQYSNMTVMYDRVLRHKTVNYFKQDTIWNVNINVPARSMKGVLMLFKEPQTDFQYNTETFYNPKITKIETIIEGQPNQLYAQGMKPHQQWDESRKFFGVSPGSKYPCVVGEVVKDLHLSDVSLGEFLNDKYALWLDLRTSDDDKLHGTGRRIENTSEGITLQIAKTADGTGPIKAYIFLIMDAQLNIVDGRYNKTLY